MNSLFQAITENGRIELLTGQYPDGCPVLHSSATKGVIKRVEFIPDKKTGYADFLTAISILYVCGSKAIKCAPL